MNKIIGKVEWSITNPDGSVAATGASTNVVTASGERVYAARGAGSSEVAFAPTGMKLGTGSTSPSRTGAGSTLANYLNNSHQDFDTGFPGVASTPTGWSATYQCVFPAGKATSAGAITEAVIVNDTLANATSPASSTLSRVLLTGIPSKSSAQTLTVTWSHIFLGG